MIVMILSMVTLGLLGLAWVVQRRSRTGNAAQRDILAIAMFVPLTAIFFWRFLFQANTWMPKGGGDLNSYYYPVYRFAAENIRQGIIPLWNPHLHSGSPFAADMEASLFYPPLLFTYLVANPFTYVTLESLLVFHYFIAAAGMYLYARTLGLGSVPAFAAGSVFAFGGFMVARLGHANILFATVWFPLTLLFFHRTLRMYRLSLARASRGCQPGRDDTGSAPSAGPNDGARAPGRGPDPTTASIMVNAVAAGAFYGITILGGHPQMPLYFALFLGLYWVWAVVVGAEVSVDSNATLRQRLRLCAGTLRYVLLVPLVGLGIAAVQLLPTIELAGLSVRANISYRQAAEYAMEPQGLITMVVPHFFGNSFSNYWGLTWNLTEIYAYVGVATLLLAGLSLVARTQGPTTWVAFFSLAAGLFLLASMGDNSILHGWMYAFLPMFNKVRAAGRNLVFVDLSLALLAAYGLESLMRIHEGPQIRFMTSLWRKVSGLALAALILATPSFILALIVNRDSDAELFQRTLVAVTSYAWSAAFLVLTMAAVWLAIRDRRWRTAAPVLLLAIIVADLVVSNSNFNPTSQDITKAYAKSDIVDFLLEEGSAQRIDSDTGISDVWQPNMPLIHRFSDVGGLDKPLFYAPYRKFWQNLGSRSSRAYDLLGARYLVARKGAKLDPAKFKLAKTGAGALDIYKNRSALPRAVVVPRAEVATPEDTLKRLKSSGFDPTKVVLLHSTARDFARSGNQEFRGEVHSISSRPPNEVLVSATGGEAAFLVLNNVMYPGWKAYVDGKETEVLWANYVFRAVELPAGKHEVRFVFDPWTFRVGAGITIVSCIFVLGVVGVGIARRRA